MIYVGIDVAKDKHDCFIINSDKVVLADVFTIANNREGFETLLQRIKECATSSDEISVGLEATGHYSYNILGFLLDNGLPTYVINPLHTNCYRKSLRLCQTKTDKIDARMIASMLMSEIDLTSYTSALYHNDELKQFARYRFAKVSDRATLKQAVCRLVNILFPELETLVSSLHLSAVYALLHEFPGAKQIATANLTRLTTILSRSSRGRFGREEAVKIRETARRSIGTAMEPKSLELRHTIHLIAELDEEIEEIESAIKAIIDKIAHPILTVPGIGYDMGAIIIGEVGDFSRFQSPDQLLAYAGLSPSTYESGKFKATGACTHMEKHGSRYLRYALINATKHVCRWTPSFSDYLAKKLAEGKHYFVALSHAAKKLVRLIFALQRSGRAYEASA